MSVCKIFINIQKFYQLLFHVAALFKVYNNTTQFVKLMGKFKKAKSSSIVITTYYRKVGKLVLIEI